MPIINKEMFRKIERELYSYPQKLKIIIEQRSDVLYGTVIPEVSGISGGNIGNQTQSKALKLAELTDDKWVKLISDAMTTLPEEYKILIQLRYFERKETESAVDQLHISRSLYFAWRENMIYYLMLMATQRGLMKPFKENVS